MSVLTSTVAAIGIIASAGLATELPPTSNTMREVRWTNDRGQGDRRSVITVSHNGNTGSDPASNIVSGSTSDGIWFRDSPTAIVIKLDLQVVKRVAAVALISAGLQGWGQWKLRGSLDDITYYDLSAPVDMGWPNPGIVGGDIIIANVDTEQRYIALVQTGGSLSSATLNEVELCLVGEADSPTLIAPSYSNLLGQGNRNPYMGRADTIVWNTTYGPQLFVDGRSITGIWLNGGSGGYLGFDTIAPSLITELTWKQSGAQTQGTWKWQAYDDATSSWIDLTSTFNIGSGGADTVVTAMSTVTNYYRLYRLQQTSGSVSSGPWQYEIEFKIGYPAAGAS